MSSRPCALACCAALIAPLVLPRPARAWNDEGHMTVAAVAYARLKPAVRARVDALIRLNPYYSQWIVGVPQRERGRIAFLRASYWPDSIKARDSGYIFDGFEPHAPNATRNIGYADKLQHQYWHFIDTPFSSEPGEALPPIPDVNALTEIETFTRALSSPDSSADIRSYDLVWLVHLTGDVHQPLHCVTRVTPFEPKGDRGGNDLKVCFGPCPAEGRLENLHGIWDGALGREHDPRAAIELARLLPKPDRRKAADIDPQRWIEEGFRLAERVVYAEPIGIGLGPYQIDAAYRRRQRIVAEQQAALAGYRLARLLNTIMTN